MMIQYENKIETLKCPKCKVERALDWFVLNSDVCWKCRCVGQVKIKEDYNADDIFSSPDNEIEAEYNKQAQAKTQTDTVLTNA